MFNFFNKQTLAFVSYRNIATPGGVHNYELVQRLNNRLQVKCHTVPPKALPSETLFTAYSVAKFLHQTFSMLDAAKHFIILDSLYFDDQNHPTSIWTQAEFAMWSYYDRGGFLNAHKDKDPHFILATPCESTNEFEFSDRKLTSLNQRERTLLRAASMDFDSGHLSGPVFYSKFSDLYIISCHQCGNTNLASGKFLVKTIESGEPLVCKCDNEINIKRDGKHIIGKQSPRKNRSNITIFDALALLYTDNPPFPILN